MVIDLQKSDMRKVTLLRQWKEAVPVSLSRLHDCPRRSMALRVEPKAKKNVRLAALLYLLACCCSALDCANCARKTYHLHSRFTNYLSLKTFVEDISQEELDIAWLYIHSWSNSYERSRERV